MGPSTEWQRWAGRVCAGLVALLATLGYYFGNVRFAPVAAGFAILAVLFYSGRLIATAPTNSLSNSGRHRAL
jgi:hypothetical protein